MSLLPSTVHEAVTQKLNLGASLHVTSLTGGDVNRAALVETKTERMVVKWNADAPPGVFEAEVDGLRRLQEAGQIRVPHVLAFDDVNELPWLALEYISTTPPTNARHFAQRFGQALADLHRGNPAPDGCFGLDRDNYLGAQPQHNSPGKSWPDFYRDQRLRPQMERAQGLELLPPQRKRLLMRVMDTMEALMDGLTPHPVLIHGDLWSGNFLSNGDEPVLIDPAVYYAEREIELAYTELFGGFPAGFHAAYHAMFPLNDGYERRRPLHQLYPLLIHLNHFGETYGLGVDHACIACFQ